MFFLSDVNAIEFGEKRNTKVKSYVRKGRIVKQHDRKIDIKSALIGGGIGALGVGALTGAYLLGKGRVKPQQVVQQFKVDTDEIANKVLSRIPQPQQPNIVVNVDNKDLINAISKLKNELPIQQQSNNISPTITNNVIDVPISKITLPQKINSLSEKTIDRLTKQAEEMTDDQLEKEITKYAKQFDKSTKTQLDISNARTLESYIDQYKKGSKKFDKDYLKKQIDELLDYFKLPKQDIEKVEYNFDIDKEYVSKLNKLRTRNKNLLDIHQNELTRRRNTNRVIAAPSDENTSRIYDLLDDFAAANELVEFCNKMNQLNDSHLFFLSDLDITFARKLGSKDKVKRMSRLGAGLRIGTTGLLGATTGGIIGSGFGKKGLLIGSAIGGLAGTGASYFEHKRSIYSPIGKKKWRNYPVEPKVYGIPVQRLSLIKGLDQQ